MIRALIFCSLLVAVFAGCTPQSDSVAGAVPVRGTLMKGGEPLQVEGRDIGVGSVNLTFIPKGGGQTFGATADASGKFTIPGGIPPGEYRVAVRQWDPYPNDDKLQGRYDEERTPLTVKVDGKTELKIGVE